MSDSERPLPPEHDEEPPPAPPPEPAPARLTPPPERAATWVDHEEALRALADEVRAAPLVALDTEANSMHAYREQTCIVQLTIPQHDSVIDALAFENLDPLRDALDRTDVEIVMHGGDYDISVLTRDFGFRFEHVFDTMIAATILGRKQLGLAALVDEHFDVQLDKRFQRADWGRRPVSDDQMLYLQRDTIYLLPLREHLLAELQAAGLMEVAEIEFRRLARRTGKPWAVDPEGWRRVKGSNKLDAIGRCVLRALHAWREQEAEKRNQPPFKVFAPRTMLALAAKPPRRARHPRELPFLSVREQHRYGRAVLAAVQRGLEAHAAGDIPPARVASPLSPEEAHRLRSAKKVEDRLRAWRRDEAGDRKVPNLVVLPNPALEWLARETPRTREDLLACEDLGPERVERYGATLLELVAGRGGS